MMRKKDWVRCGLTDVFLCIPHFFTLNAARELLKSARLCIDAT